MARIHGLDALRCLTCWEPVGTDAAGFAPVECPACGASLI